jgi:putative redox protein
VPQTVTGTVIWAHDLAFDGESGSGHEVRLDSRRESGASPLELVLLGTGACSSVDVVTLLKQMQQDVRTCRCELTAVRAEVDPKVFTRVHFHFIVSGRDLEAAKVEDAIRLSEQRYGSAAIMLGKTAEISHDFKLVSV